MSDAVLFKIIQRQMKFRNSKNLLKIPDAFQYSQPEFESAKDYISNLEKMGIKYSFPGDACYPTEFLKMNEPPLFFEYQGPPLWKTNSFLSVIGSRKIHTLSEQWIKNNLNQFADQKIAGIVSGGAMGVDQLAHLIAIKNNCPTVFILPSGLLNLYPKSLEDFKQLAEKKNVCFISEFESRQNINKSHFYFRNRLIAALGRATLVVQSSLKSGSLLTVHHCLEIGKPILTIPTHPEILGFEGNLKLIFDGAIMVRDFEDLRDFWYSENWTGSDQI